MTDTSTCDPTSISSDQTYARSTIPTLTNDLDRSQRATRSAVVPMFDQYDDNGTGDHS